MQSPVATPFVDVVARERVGMARAAGWLLVGAAVSSAVLVAVPGEVAPGADRTGWVSSPAAAMTGLLMLRYAERVPMWLFDVLLVAVNLICAVQLQLIASTGRLLGGEVLFLPGVVFACAMFSPLRAIAHLVVVAAALGWVYGSLDEPAEVITQRLLLVIGFFGMTGVLVGVLRQRVHHLIGELDRQARTDALTSLLNRRGTLEALEQALDLGRRQGIAVTLVAADIDHFKAVNDAFGHPAGDGVLVRVSDVLRRSVRAHDHVGRLGGEEFALVLVGADRSEAVRFAARAAETLGHLRLLPDGGGLTLSFGVAQAGTSSTPHGLLQRADDALYAAKRAGRDRTVVAEPEPEGSARTDGPGGQQGGAHR